ncbi:MAG: putative binding protein [Nevskia sp.]|nr:putative binding protein [Nevskia sp.]
MTKADLVKNLADACDITGTVADAILSELAVAVRKDLIAGNEISLPDIGKFKVAHTAARSGRNPSTGATIQIAAAKKVKFVPAKSLKDSVNS